MSAQVRIPAEELHATFLAILKQNDFTVERAEVCAGIFTQNSVDGVYSHGVNRFGAFVSHIRKGYVKPDREPVFIHAHGALEQWDGQLGSGPNNALFATERAMVLAKTNGIGCVGLSHTNHWMRAGYYARHAAKAGFIFMGWTNTIANMPAWGARDCRLGNNPLAMAVPNQPEPIVIDMAMSQFSFGAMETAARSNKQLPLPGGYDASGILTDDPGAILRSQRALPVGYWKGAGMSFLLDMIAAILSGGDTTSQISGKEAEFGVSQVFIAINVAGSHFSGIASQVRESIDYLKNSIPVSEAEKVFYPGERTLQRRQENTEKGIPVDANLWDEVLRLK